MPDWIMETAAGAQQAVALPSLNVDLRERLGLESHAESAKPAFS
jgi:hypothetical protein